MLKILKSIFIAFYLDQAFWELVTLFPMVVNQSYEFIGIEKEYDKKFQSMI